LTSDPFLFYFLVVGMNAPWAVVPVCLWLESWEALVGREGGGAGRRRGAKEKFETLAPSTPGSASVAEGRTRRRRGGGRE
jgi:hypothetical protein